MPRSSSSSSIRSGPAKATVLSDGHVREEGILLERRARPSAAPARGRPSPPSRTTSARRPRCGHARGSAARRSRAGHWSFRHPTARRAQGSRARRRALARAGRSGADDRGQREACPRGEKLHREEDGEADKDQQGADRDGDVGIEVELGINGEGIVWVIPCRLPANMIVAPNSPVPRAQASAEPAPSPVADRGRATRKNVRFGSRPASGMRRSESGRRLRRTRSPGGCRREPPRR